MSDIPNRTTQAARRARLEQALAGKPSQPFDLSGIPCCFRLLTDAQKGSAWLHVLTELDREGIELTERTETVAESMKLRRWMALAVLDAETQAPLGTPEDWEALADTPTLRYLLEEYMHFEQTRRPATEADAAAMYAEIREHLGKPDRALADILRTYGTSALASFATSMVRRHESCPTCKSPTGSSTGASS